MKETTDVLFLIDNGQESHEVFAYFPNEVFDSVGNPTCYSRVGQHSACAKEYCNECEEATEEEYMDLFEELRRIGYELNILNTTAYE